MPDGNGHSLAVHLAVDLAHDRCVSSRYGASSRGLVSNPTPPHVVSSFGLGLVDIPTLPHVVSSSSFDLVGNPTRAPPHMAVARTAHGWEPWVYALSAKQRNLLAKEMNLSRQEANSLKEECRKRRQRKAQSEYVSDYCLFVCCATASRVLILSLSRRPSGTYHPMIPRPIPWLGRSTVDATHN